MLRPFGDRIGDHHDPRRRGRNVRLFSGVSNYVLDNVALRGQGASGRELSIKFGPTLIRPWLFVFPARLRARTLSRGCRVLLLDYGCSLNSGVRGRRRVVSPRNYLRDLPGPDVFRVALLNNMLWVLVGARRLDLLWPAGGANCTDRPSRGGNIAKSLIFMPMAISSSARVADLVVSSYSSPTATSAFRSTRSGKLFEKRIKA